MIGILLAAAVAASDTPHQVSLAAMPVFPQQEITLLEEQGMYNAKCGMANGGYGFSWSMTPHGVYIMAVAPGSRAEAAGLKAGEGLLEINGQSTAAMTRSQFSALIHSKPPNGFELTLYPAFRAHLPSL
jgi:C-terminal processing protease CtpA/Prc